MLKTLLCLCLLFAICGPTPARAAAEPGPELTPSEATALGAAAVPVSGAFSGLLVSLAAAPAHTDDKFGQVYRAQCIVYAVDTFRSDGAPAAYARRAVIYAPTAADLPFARRAARLLLLLNNELRMRLRMDHPGGQNKLEVWLSPQKHPGDSADIAGEQFRDQIYFYQIYTERTGIEWAREIAHEYGHFVLPGVTGFTAPEAWANGYLGEHLFLRWIYEDLANGHLTPESVPFATTDALRTEADRRITPLIAAIARSGVNAHSLALKTGEGMNTYIGLALYLDMVNGANALREAMLCTAPGAGHSMVEAPDFLRGATAALNDADPLRYTFTEALGPAMMVYLPTGKFRLSFANGSGTYRLAPDVKGATLRGDGLVRVTTAGWRRLTITAKQLPVTLELRRVGTEKHRD